MKRIISSLHFLIMLVTLNAQVELGEKAPDILVDAWVNNPAYDFKLIDGKIIILDFWFTHCAPCIYTIPHLNDLSEKHEDEGVVFVAVTFEKEAAVAKFITKREMLSNIGIDTTYHLAKSFEVVGYPTTFLIDSNGLLRWKGYPAQLSSEIIEVVLEKKNYPHVRPDIALFNRPAGDLTAREHHPIAIQINDNGSGASGFMFNSNELNIVNKSLNEALTVLFKTSKMRISISDTNKYDIRFIIPEHIAREQVNEVITESILNEFDYELFVEKQKVNGYQLEVVNDSLFITNAIDNSKEFHFRTTSTTESFWKGEGIGIFELVKELENRFEVHISDLTKLNGF